MSVQENIKIRNTDTGSMESIPVNDVHDGQIMKRSGNAIVGDSQVSLTEHLADTPIHRRIFTKAIQVTLPLGTERIMIFRTDKELTCSAIAAIVRGTAPSVTWNVKWATDLTGLEQAAFTSAGPQTTTDDTIGDLLDPDTNPIPADAWVWLITTAIAGTVDEFAATLYLEETGL
jgi:hypothetical protein